MPISAEHPLLDSVAGMRMLVDLAPTALFLADAAGRIVYRNRAGEEALAAATDQLGVDGSVAFRRAILRAVETAPRYPVRQAVRVAGHGAGELVVSDVPGGVLVAWYGPSDPEEGPVAAGLPRSVRTAGVERAAS